MRDYQCLVVDDEPLARELIKAHLEKLNQFSLVASCATAIEASQYLKDHDIDLMFLDIEMPVLRGIDFYRSLTQRPEVIFTTAYRDYAVDGFELEALDYLLKPITFARFFKAIERFLKVQKSGDRGRNGYEQLAVRPPGMPGERQHILVRSERKDVKIVLNDILYIQSLKDYLQIHTSAKTHIVKDSITAMSARLQDSFLRVHRSYIVNPMHITAITKHDIEIGDIEIPVGETYRDLVSAALKNASL